MNMSPPSSKVNDQYRAEKPKRLRDVPGYIKRLVKDTGERMF